MTKEKAASILMWILIAILILTIIAIVAGAISEAARISRWCRNRGYIGYVTYGDKIGENGPVRAYCIDISPDGDLIVTEVPQELIGLNPFK
jgi:hypothetical protein